MVTVNLADVVDIDDMIRRIMYCGECEAIKPDFVPEEYPEEIKCTCTEEEDTSHEYLFW